MQRYTYIGWQDTIVSGWGGLSADPFVLPAVLQWAKVPPVSDATCTQAYSSSLPADTTWPADTTICTGLDFFFSRIATLANPEVKSFCSQLELSELVIKNQDIIYFRFWCEGHLFWRYWKSPGDQSHRGRLRLLTDWSCQFRAMCCS